MTDKRKVKPTKSKRGRPKTPGLALEPAAAPASALDRLDPRRRLFVREYLVDWDAGAAYSRAGYKAAEGPSRTNAASRLLHEPGVAAAIDELVRVREDRLDATRENVIAELALVAFADLRDVMRWGPDGAELIPSEQLSPLAARALRSIKCTRRELRSAADSGGGPAAGVAIEQVTVQATMHDKMAALTALAKRLGLLSPDPADSGDGRVDLRQVATLTEAELIERINQGIAGARAAAEKPNGK